MLALNRVGDNHITEVATSTITGSLRKEVEGASLSKSPSVKIYTGTALVMVATLALEVDGCIACMVEVEDNKADRRLSCNT